MSTATVPQRQSKAKARHEHSSCATKASEGKARHKLVEAAQAGDPASGETEEAPAGIGRYRIGASDPLSQKIAAELQGSVGKGAAGGGKFVMSKSSVQRAADAKKAAEDRAEEAAGCWGGAEGGGGGFMCCTSPAKVKE